MNNPVHVPFPTQAGKFLKGEMLCQRASALVILMSVDFCSSLTNLCTFIPGGNKRPLAPQYSVLSNFNF